MDSRALGLRLILPWILAAGFAAQAGATNVYGSHAILRWNPSTGPVWSYAVYVDRNGAGFTNQPEFMTPAPIALVSGEIGETIRVRVAAFRLDRGELGPASAPSPPLRFVPPQPPASAPSLIENGGFEEGGPGPGNHFWTAFENWTLPGWRVFGHSIEWSGGFWSAAEGVHSIDLNGLWGGGLSQVLATEPGRFYYVYYRLGALPECPPWVYKTFRIAAAGESDQLVIDATGRTRADPGWFQPDPFVFQADAEETTLELSSADGSGACGPLIDDVVVRAEP